MFGDFVARERLDMGGFSIPHGPSVIGMIKDISKSPETPRHIDQRLYRSLRLPQTLKCASNE